MVRSLKRKEDVPITTAGVVDMMDIAVAVEDNNNDEEMELGLGGGNGVMDLLLKMLQKIF